MGFATEQARWSVATAIGLAIANATAATNTIAIGVKVAVNGIASPVEVKAESLLSYHRFKSQYLSSTKSATSLPAKAEIWSGTVTGCSRSRSNQTPPRSAYPLHRAKPSRRRWMCVIARAQAEDGCKRIGSAHPPTQPAGAGRTRRLHSLRRAIMYLTHKPILTGQRLRLSKPRIIGLGGVYDPR